MVVINPTCITDIIIDAMNDGNMKILTPIISKYDKEFSKQNLTGDLYRNYMNKINADYINAIGEKK